MQRLKSVVQPAEVSMSLHKKEKKQTRHLFMWT